MNGEMNKNLLIIGAGDYGQIAYEIAEAMGKFDKIDFLDDKSQLTIGKVSDIEKFAGKYSFGIVAIGNVDTRYCLTPKNWKRIATRFRYWFIQKLLWVNMRLSEKAAS